MGAFNMSWDIILVVTKKSVARQKFPQSTACLLILLNQFMDDFHSRREIKLVYMFKTM